MELSHTIQQSQPAPSKRQYRIIKQDFPRDSRESIFTICDETGETFTTTAYFIIGAPEVLNSMSPQEIDCVLYTYKLESSY
jgi:hypothetical protein